MTSATEPRLVIGILGLSAMVIAPALTAAPPRATVGAETILACAGCHGTDHQGFQSIPPIAGKNKQAFIRSMQAFRTGKRPATVMERIAKAYSDDELATLADALNLE